MKRQAINCNLKNLMKLNHLLPMFGGISLWVAATITSPAQSSSTIVLDEVGVRNLGIQTVEADYSHFEQTLFALGYIAPIPDKTAVVSSRIAGRLVQLGIVEGDIVKSGQEVARVESRQPGNNPPAIPLTTPVAGLVMSCEYRMGEPITPDTVIARVADLSEVYAVAHVPEYYASEMRAGRRARIRVLALGEELFTGELLRMGTKVDKESGTLEVVFKLDNPENLLRPGMRAEFHIVMNEREGVLSVPRQAIQGTPSSRHVYVRDFSLPNAFVKAMVQVGEISGEQAEIVSGIFPGDEVVTKGAYALGFAGGAGTISLKEALDAAHGHPHNEDGSEMSTEQLAALQASENQHGHSGQAAGLSLRELFFMIATAVLGGLLVLNSLRNSQGKKSGN